MSEETAEGGTVEGVVVGTEIKRPIQGPGIWFGLWGSQDWECSRGAGPGSCYAWEAPCCSLPLLPWDPLHF